MDINYQKQMDKIVAALRGRQPRLLLQSCCGPCSSAVLETLTRYFDVALFWYNPNIYPQSEFNKRFENQIKVIEDMAVLESGETFYNADDVSLLSHIIYAEAGNQPIAGKIGVGDVVMNRVASDRFPDTVKDVIYAPGQFEPVQRGSIGMVELYGTAIGLIGLTEIGAASARLYLRIGEVGYNSVRSAAYAALPMLRYAFYRLGLQTVQLDAAAGNAEAAAVFSKMGFLARGGPGAETAELTLTRADFARHEGGRDVRGLSAGYQPRPPLHRQGPGGHRAEGARGRHRPRLHRQGQRPGALRAGHQAFRPQYAGHRPLAGVEHQVPGRGDRLCRGPQRAAEDQPRDQLFQG